MQPGPPRKRSSGSSRAARRSPSGLRAAAPSSPGRRCPRWPRPGTRRWSCSMPPSPELGVAPAGLSRFHVEDHQLHMLSEGWQAACTPADQHCDAAGLDGLSWVPARVPGTAAGALRDAGLWRPGEARSFDAQPVAPGEEASLQLDGIATVSEVYLNGERILESDSMFATHKLPLTGRLRTASGGGSRANELAICCRALAPLLAQSRRPRARWRTRLVAER